MPKPTKGARLASGPAHQKHLIRGMVASLIIEERIRTTEAKARLVSPYADKMVTLGKADTLHARRRALRWIEDDDIVHKLFAEVAPRFHDRNGGYTRILKLGPRKGDGAPMAILEFVEETETAASGSSQEAAARKRRLGRKKGETEAPKARSRKKAAASEADDAEPDEDEQVPAAEPVAEATPAEEEVGAGESGGDEEPEKA